MSCFIYLRNWNFGIEFLHEILQLLGNNISSHNLYFIWKKESLFSSFSDKCFGKSSRIILLLLNLDFIANQFIAYRINF